jgi:hypothetical protein
LIGSSGGSVTDDQAARRLVQLGAIISRFVDEVRSSSRVMFIECRANHPGAAPDLILDATFMRKQVGLTKKRLYGNVEVLPVKGAYVSNPAGEGGRSYLGEISAVSGSPD